MKFAHVVAVSAVILLGLFAWTRSHGVNDDTQAREQALRALDAFAIAESELHRDVLNARAGMLRNYDFLVSEDRAMRAALEHIPERGRLAALVEQEGELVERFKSRNALLQISLVHFELFSAQLVSRQGPQAPRVSGLTGTMLQLTLDTSPEVLTNVDAHLAEVAALTFPAQDAPLADGLLAHARMLRKVLPNIDALLKSLFALSSEAELGRIRERILEQQRAGVTRARRARYALIVTSLLLLARLVQLGMRLRARALSLRRRAAIEHIIAGISTRFINSRPHETDTLIGQALAELAQFIAADRAYFLVIGSQAGVYKWCSPNASFPPQWPEGSLALAPKVRVNSEGVIEAHQADEVRPAVKEALAAAAITTWLCIPSKGGAQLESLLAFDYAGSRPGAHPRELGLLRMALDAICNAVERRGLEQDRERLEANLQHARRMETIGALASGIAHNFNNIVGAILGFTEGAQLQVPATARVGGSLSEIRRAGERARDLVDQILTFGRRRAVHRARISVREWIDEARSLLEATLPPHVRLVVHETTPGVMVYGELTSLQQVILNVCNNAAQAMDAAGTIGIQIAIRDLEPVRFTGPAGLAAGQYVVITITDPGRGMDQATLERAFEPFFTTRAEGNGLGLALVREVVSEHGGTVRIRSTAGVGTRVDIWLPCSSSALPLADSESYDAMGRGGGESVLLLEASRERLLRHEEILAALGYEPVGFTQVAEAEAALLAEPTRYDIALFCARSQDSTAVLAWVGALRRKAPQLPVLLATSAVADFVAPALAEAGITAIIRQPLNSAELAGALGRCITGRRTVILQSQHLLLPS